MQTLGCDSYVEIGIKAESKREKMKNKKQSKNEV